jgi:hypothetical protein
LTTNDQRKTFLVAERLCPRGRPRRIPCPVFLDCYDGTGIAIDFKRKDTDPFGRSIE